jgi:hypothetical protein
LRADYDAKKKEFGKIGWAAVNTEKTISGVGLKDDTINIQENN